MTALEKRVRLGAARTRLSVQAWGAAVVTAGFIAVTCVWLALDNAVQVNDAAQHLYVAVRFHEFIERGELETLFTLPNYYPPMTFLVGALAMFVGGVHVGTAVIAQNLIYVPLLAIACYQVGKLLAGATAGLLAVIFALGAPLIIEQFHVFMLDAPQAALVAVTVWQLLVSERFRRFRPCVLAGVALGIGIASKSLAPIYLLGLVAALLARGGWRNWRGLLAFGGVAFAIGSPWYLYNHERLDGLLTAAGPAGAMIPPAARPALLSLDNALWYFWATLNNLLLAPLFVLAAIGVGAACVRVLRKPSRQDLTLELLAGLLGAWAVVTVMPHKDVRYTIALILFLAVLATAWIVRLQPPWRQLAVGSLVAAVALAHVGATIGVGGTTERRLPGSRLATLGEGVPLRDRVVVYTNHNFLVSGPQPNGEVLRLFRALHAKGLKGVYWEDGVDATNPVFDPIGLFAFAQMARLRADPLVKEFDGLSRDDAVAIRAYELDQAGPCIRLADGTGVWVRRGDPYVRGARNYCPLQQPAVYGP